MTNWILATKGAKKRSFAILALGIFMGTGSLGFCLALLLYQIIYYPAAYLAVTCLVAILLIAFSIGEENAHRENN